MTHDEFDKLAAMTGGIAHDYNNILTVILGNISLVEHYPGVEGEIQDALNSIRKATKQALDITQTLIAFSKIGDPNFLQHNSIQEVVKETFYAVFPGENYSLEFNSFEDLPAVHIDIIQFTYALQNIFKFFKGCAKLVKTFCIKLENYHVDRERFIRIAIVVPELVLSQEKINTLFIPAFSTQKPDYGIGIIGSLVVMQKHKGHLAVSSDHNSGTTFEILLPV